MKKLLAFILLAVMSLATVTLADVGPVGRSAKLDGKGAIQPGSTEKWFINVKNVSGGALLDGDVVVLDVTSDDGYSVTTSTTAGDTPVCVYAEACAAGAMCKCWTKPLSIRKQCWIG